MERVDFIFTVVESVLYIIIALLALIYAFPILCIRRFQHRNNIFTLNVCVSTILSCLSWLWTCISPIFGYPWLIAVQMWPWLYVLQILADMAIPFSLVLVSFHRCCSIVYPHKRFFRTKTWIVMCFVGQWLIMTLLSIPDFVHPRWVRVLLRRAMLEIVSMIFVEG